MALFEILCGIAAVILACYYYFTSTFDFWKSRNVRGPRPIPVFGNFKDVTFNKTTAYDCLAKAYNDYKDEKMYGMFGRTTPLLILKDPDLIKDVLIKDFSIFANRGFPTFKKVRILKAININAIKINA